VGKLIKRREKGCTAMVS